MRCEWAGTDPLMIAYHDNEWGKLVQDDRVLFEFLILEGAQAGLTWQTVLRRREGYRKAFDNFDPVKVAKYDAKKMAQLLLEPGIIRNRLKIASAVRNARAFLAIQKEFGSFDNYLQTFAAKPIINSPVKLSDIPAKTHLSDAVSKDLQKREMNFVGSTIIYAFLQAVGIVNDHITSCKYKK